MIPPSSDFDEFARRLTELRVTSKDLIKDTGGHPGEEIHK